MWSAHHDCIARLRVPRTSPKLLREWCWWPRYGLRAAKLAGPRTLGLKLALDLPTFFLQPVIVSEGVPQLSPKPRFRIASRLDRVPELLPRFQSVCTLGCLPSLSLAFHFIRSVEECFVILDQFCSNLGILLVQGPRKFAMFAALIASRGQHKRLRARWAQPWQHLLSHDSSIYPSGPVYHKLLFGEWGVRWGNYSNKRILRRARKMWRWRPKLAMHLQGHVMRMFFLSPKGLGLCKLSFRTIPSLNDGFVFCLEFLVVLVIGSLLKRFFCLSIHAVEMILYSAKS